MRYVRSFVAKNRPAQLGWRPGGDLTPLEEDMVAAAGAGELVDRNAGPCKPAEMQTWGKKRSIRAAVLRHLLIAGQWPVDTKGVRLRGVRITGPLEFEAAVVHCPLSLDCCYLDTDQPVCLDHATAPRITLTSCQLAGLTGQMLTTRELDLSGSTLTGPLSLRGADIAGKLNCRGAQLTGCDQDGNALAADMMKVGGDVLFDKGFTATGAVRLPGANIAGQLACRGAQLIGADNSGNALFADIMKVSGGAFFDLGFTAAGAVRLPGADIAVQLACHGAQLIGHDQDGDALVADGIKVSGDVLLNGEFTAAGAVRLPGADIAGDLNCRGAQLTGADSDALVANGIKVGGDVFLDEGCTAAGSVWMMSARVGGSVRLEPAVLAGEDKAALNVARTQITGRLRWAPRQLVSGSVNLEGATASELDDDWRERANGCWPVNGRVRLNGFTYDRFAGDQQATVEQRLAWIRSQYQGDNPAPFATLPYEQLAAVYRRAGQDTQARKVAIARRTDLRKYGNLNPYRKFGNWFLDWSIKYGYQTWRAAAALAAVFVVFLVFSFLAQQHHLMEPVGITVGLPSLPSATKCTSSYPCFYPVGYTIDTVIPLINVHQAANWGPDGHTTWGHVWVVGTWVATVLGWVLATLLVAGYTGLVRRD